ncbi:prepilin-type N-terminal cleavage/methylation domain-containing protein [Paraphotobacterium marinum]|uniref:prepilin-type N-terminal cleavage/methylation domain-containing protein n=1 Tax=Paraphotobacterium marinum TaxID=1755811 RepID=UPI0039E79929
MNTKGFTLLEVLLVLLIISSLVFIVSINLPETKKNSQSTKEFERLFIQLNNLYDESVLFNRSYLVTFTDNKYFFFTVTQKGFEKIDSQNSNFKSVNSSKLNFKLLKNENLFKNDLNNIQIKMENNETVRPSIILESNGFIAPFELEVFNSSNESKIGSIFINETGKLQKKYESAE